MPIASKALASTSASFIRQRASNISFRSLSSTSVASSSKQAPTAASSAIKKVAVIGCGQMGAGIAYVAAKNAQVDVYMHDASAAALDKGLKFLESLIAKDLSKSKLTDSAATSLRSRLIPTPSLSTLGKEDVDLVLEAASESLPLKQKIFASLAETVRPDAILGTNTSSISISKIARAAVKQGEDTSSAGSAGRVVGIHWMNPVPVMKLVEMIPALQTRPEVLQRAQAFAESCGKTCTTSQDTPGFIANRLLMPYLNEAIITLETGVASKEDIDKTMRLGMAHPMGPLTLADFIGLDTCLAIMETLYRETGDSKYRASVLLARMVDAGWLGKKSGKGFYDY